jgi:hypothetical protein
LAARNWVPLRTPNVFTAPHCIATPPAAEHDGVSCQSPASAVSGRKNCGGADPSFARRAISAAAAAFPTAMPPSFCGPLGMDASDCSRAVDSAITAAGK